MHESEEFGDKDVTSGHKMAVYRLGTRQDEARCRNYSMKVKEDVER